MNAKDPCHGCTEAIHPFGGLANTGCALNIRVHLRLTGFSRIISPCIPLPTACVPLFPAGSARIARNTGGKPPGEIRIVRLDTQLLAHAPVVETLRFGEIGLHARAEFDTRPRARDLGGGPRRPTA